MSFTVSDLPSPELRTPAHWLAFYLRCEQAVMMGARVRVGGVGESHEIELPPMSEIRKQLSYWRAQNNLQQQKAAGKGCGAGSCYMPRLG